MSAEARGPFPVVPLGPVEEQWVTWLTNAVCEVDPTAVRDKVRAMTVREFTVPRPRDPRDDFEPPAEDVLSQRESDYVADREEAKETRWREVR